MRVVVNGNELVVPEGTTVADLIGLVGARDEAVAVEINRGIVARSGRAGRRLAEGDRVEIVHFVGGG